jgi:hypothetical protein
VLTFVDLRIEDSNVLDMTFDSNRLRHKSLTKDIWNLVVELTSTGSHRYLSVHQSFLDLDKARADRATDGESAPEEFVTDLRRLRKTFHTTWWSMSFVPTILVQSSWWN